MNVCCVVCEYQGQWSPDEDRVRHGDDRVCALPPLDVCHLTPWARATLENATRAALAEKLAAVDVAA